MLRIEGLLNALGERPRLSGCGQATHQVIVYQAHSLHRGVHRRRPDEDKAALFECLGQGHGFWDLSRNIGELTTPRRQIGPEGPEQLVQCTRAHLSLESDKRLRIGDGRVNFGSISDNSDIIHESIAVPISKAGNHHWVELRECSAK